MPVKPRRIHTESKLVLRHAARLITRTAFANCQYYIDVMCANNVTARRVVYAKLINVNKQMGGHAKIFERRAATGPLYF